MKAMVCTEYGSPAVLRLEEVAEPVPKDDEVLIRIVATTVTAGDCEARRFTVPLWIWLPLRLYMGIRKPRRGILGQELAGEIVSVGRDVQHFKQGDRVFGPTEISFGAYAEYICLPETYAITTKPANMSYAEAAAIPVGGLNALYFLRKGRVRPGQRVLINGAAGSIGTIAVQIAKVLEAEVTGVDSTGKLEMLRTIGADHVIDYTKEDFTRSGETYDVILDVVGKSPFSRCVKSLRPNGRYILANPGLSQLIRGIAVSATGNKKVITGLAGYKPEDLLFLKELIEAEKIKTVIDRRYPLEQLAEAHRYVETGQKVGCVVISVSHDESSPRRWRASVT